jgi:hypothetical protein
MLRYARGYEFATVSCRTMDVVPGASGTARLGRTRFSDRDLAADFDNLIARQIKIICHMGGIALHEDE